LFGNLNRKGYLCDQGINGKIILKTDLRELGCEDVNGFNCPRLEKSNELL
jgi:hypothetical protein